jgi:hypothetical protein
MHEREGHFPRPKCFLSQVSDYNGILTAAKKQHRALKLRRSLSQYVDRLGLEMLEMVYGVR